MPRLCILDCHPDPSPERFVHALCNAYQKGAEAAGHEVSRINIAEIDVPLMTTAHEFAAPPPEPILTLREAIREADHLVIAFPLWLGGLPAKARAFLEQSARAGFFLKEGENAKEWPRKMMKGKSARVVVTMGMPGIIFAAMMDQAGLKAIERGVLGLSGFKPVKHSVLGGAEGASDKTREKWLAEMAVLGAKGA